MKYMKSLENSCDEFSSSLHFGHLHFVFTSKRDHGNLLELSEYKTGLLLCVVLHQYLDTFFN